MRALIAVSLCALTHWAGAQTLSDSSLAVSNFLSTGLQDPIAMRFTGVNEGFVIEKGGAVKRFQGSTLALSTVLDLSVATNSERGLLGIALDPQYAQNNRVYLYYSAGSGSSWTDNRLVGATWNGSALIPDAQPLATFGTSADGQANNGPNHNGGPLIFGTDGKLYGATGDLNRNGIEQNNQSATTSARVGGIYRLNTDGSTPADNPFTANANADVHRWYAYGVRNSFGLAVDPVTGRLWNTENGEGAYDEINLLSSGMNSGWTPIMGPDARSANSTANLVMLPGASYQDPEFSFERPIGITALSFLHGSAWGAQYDDAVLVGENNAGRLWLLRLNAARDGFELAGSLADGVFDPGDTFPTFGTGFNVITDITRGPDGALYLTAYGSDTIYRIAPVPEPAAWALMAAGLALVGLSRRRLGTTV